LAALFSLLRSVPLPKNTLEAHNGVWIAIIFYGCENLGRQTLTNKEHAEVRAVKSVVDHFIVDLSLMFDGNPDPPRMEHIRSRARCMNQVGKL
jgi:hypothetical protein